MLIAYSGGVDSAYLLAAATRELGTAAVGVIADSPSLPRAGVAGRVELGREVGARVEVVGTDEMSNPEYTSNPLNRCYFCKGELFARLDRMARERGFSSIAYGENADDARQVRPGLRAATEFEVVAPLKEAGLGKAEIRALSREMGLPTADQPAQPCLSSRIPHGTPVTLAALTMIEAGEAWVRGLGFRVFRVRHLVDGNGTAPRARVQIAPEEMARLASKEEALRVGLRDVGYVGVEIDPLGYRPPGG